MIVWTMQPLYVWEILQRDGILYGPAEAPELVRDFTQWRTAYHWLIEQMEQRIGPRPNPEAYPLWAWYQYYGPKQCRPDLRNRHLDSGMKGIRIEFEIAEDQILLSDLDMWHSPLNAWYLGLSEEEDEAFYAEVEGQGIQYVECMSHPVYRARIVQSWERIFDINNVHESEYWGNPQTQRIQGTFWQLSLDQVRKITPFTSR
ncbi:DUF3841 domain-containing protein [Ktedonobacter robiniae]|nr:DUF3841 domain-containing protein [Ktedonobacter robiniae]